jgi:hypothetical protein
LHVHEIQGGKSQRILTCKEELYILVAYFKNLTTKAVTSLFEEQKKDAINFHSRVHIIYIYIYTYVCIYIYHLLKHEEPNVLSIKCLYVLLMIIIINDQLNFIYTYIYIYKCHLLKHGESNVLSIVSLRTSYDYHNK